MFQAVPVHGFCHFEAASLRVGEASHPGPVTGHVLRVGTSNPTGLRSKEALAVDLGPGVFHYNETQLSEATVRSCTGVLKSLAQQQNRDLRVTTGAPAPLRPGSLWAGGWSGVLTTSDVPCRPLQLHWLHGCYHTGRIQATFHAVGNTPVLTANLYGFPAGYTHESPRHQTELLLETLTREIVIGRKGVRTISGDFNHCPNLLEQVDIWKRYGWQCAQALAAERWNQEPRATCKGATLRDFVFLSPEAAALCRQVEVRDVFAEHSTVIAELALVGVDTIRSWPQPSEIPWSHVNIPQWQASCVPAPSPERCSTTWLQQFGKHIEESLDGHCQGIPGKCLPAKCHGRGQALRPRAANMVCPSKPSRPGEESATHSLLSLEVKRWFEQLRRLQSLHHSLKAGKQTASALEYRLQLWASIKSAKGFRPCFGAWWQARAVRLQGSPVELPITVPNVATAQLVFLDFRDNYRRFEAWNVRQRSRILQEQYLESKSKLYKDLRDPSPGKVDIMVLRHEHEILDVDESTSQVHVGAPVDTRGCSLWSINGQPANVEVLSQHCCAVSGAITLSSATELEQVQTLSSVADLVSEFNALWGPRWQKHALSQPCDWQRVLDFAAAHLPVQKVDLPPLTIDMWRTALSRFRPWAARGPDGFAAQDLKALPDCLCSQLVGFLSAIEAGEHTWPAQWLLGFVHSLRKPNELQGAQGYRPIVVLSVIYRCWSSLRARQLLRHIARVMPDTALGFLPNRETTDFWWQLEALIELACLGNANLCGYSTDLEKAFNCLPRYPIFMIAAQLGFPKEVLLPWQNFLSGLSRHFVVRGHVGDAVRSTSGFPEGCGLSTVAMNVACLLFHHYLEAYAANASPHSYVDNLSCTAVSVGKLAQGITATQCFLDLLELQLDTSKTYVWAVQPQQRAQLRALGLPVLESARDLGGVISYGKAVRNALLTKRCKDLDPLFAKLRRSPAPLTQKLAALPRKFWAKALHGISGCPLANAQLASLRAAAVRALKANSAGSSALLRLSINSDLTCDPGFYQLWAVISDLRRMGRKHASTLSRWRLFMAWHRGEQGHGPFHKLLQVLSQVGWSVAAPPWVIDHEGFCHDVFAAPWELLQRRLEAAWLKFVALSHAHRPSMAGLHAIDPGLLQHDVDHLSPLNTARLAALRSGAFLFDHAHSKYDLSKTGQCVHCQVPDTREHRVCECPLYDDIRAPFPQIREEWARLPPCLTHHLLPPANPHLPGLRHRLASLEDLSGVFASTACAPGKQHLFTDGSCLLQSQSDFALAAWGVVNATSGFAISSGPVPGLLQTSPRAELWALISALKWGIEVQVGVIIWTDSLSGAKGIRRLLEDATWLPKANVDLWTQIAELVRCYSHDTLDVQHVPSHLEPKACESPLEEWLASWNGHVDLLAGQANLNRDFAFAAVHAQALCYHQQTVDVMRALRSIYFGIADRTAHQRGISADVADADDAVVEVDSTREGPRLHEEVSLNWTLRAVSVCAEMPEGFVQQACRFLIQQDKSSTEIFEISWVELLVMLLIDGGVAFPVHCPVQGRWVERQSSPLMPNSTFAVQLRVVRSVWRRSLGADVLDQFRVQDLDRVDLGIMFPLDGLRLGCNLDLLHRARAALRSWGATPFRSVGHFARPFHF